MKEEIRAQSNPGAPPTNPEQVVEQASERMRRALSPGWEITSMMQKIVGGMKPRIDAVLQLRNPVNQKLKFLVQVRRVVSIRDLGPSIQALEKLSGQGDQVMVMSRHISESAQRWLIERNISFADVTGNFRISAQDYSVLLGDRGAALDPWRGPGRPRTSLKGEAAARVIRALIDSRPPMSVPELIKRAKSSNGVAYRVLDFLEDEDLVIREESKIVGVKWQRILEQWSRDYGFQENNSVMGFFEPRGLPELLEKLKGKPELDYAVTGSLAAQRWAPYAEPRLAMMYAKYPLKLARQLDLRPVDTGVNVLIAATAFDVVFDRVAEFEGVRYVAPSQAVVDLLRAPGRNPAEGQELLTWMEKNEDEWRI